MNISNYHFSFAKYLDKVEALNNPKKYLGPHYKKVLDFWNKIDKISAEQFIVIKKRYSECNAKEHQEISALDASRKVVGENYVNGAGWNVAHNIPKSWVVYYATLEIIGNVENPVFLKMFDDL